MEIATATSPIGSVTHGPTVAYEKSIEELVQEIEARADQSDEKLIETALLAKQLKVRIEAGEAGAGVRWLEWAKVRFKLRKTQIYKLITIGSSDDPAQELKKFRVRETNRQKDHRLKLSARNTDLKTSTDDPDRMRLIDWARRAKIEKVRAALVLIENRAASEMQLTKPIKEKGQ